MIPMEDLLRLTVDEGASDLHISVGAPPTLRLKGLLTKLQVAPLSADEALGLVRSITSDAHFQRVNEEGSVDFGFSFRDENRFRVSVYRQKGNLAAALRLIPNKLKTLEEIGLPPAVRTLLDLPRGLVLVTGPTGSGKTTSLASMLNVINENKRYHIITIEDPIEYILEHKRGIVNQREVGVDVPGFAEADNIHHSLIGDANAAQFGFDSLGGGKSAISPGAMADSLKTNNPQMVFRR